VTLICKKLGKKGYETFLEGIKNYVQTEMKKLSERKIEVKKSELKQIKPHPKRAGWNSFETPKVQSLKHKTLGYTIGSNH